MDLKKKKKYFYFMDLESLRPEIQVAILSTSRNGK